MSQNRSRAAQAAAKDSSLGGYCLLRSGWLRHLEAGGAAGRKSSSMRPLVVRWCSSRGEDASGIRTLGQGAGILPLAALERSCSGEKLRQPPSWKRLRRICHGQVSPRIEYQSGSTSLTSRRKTVNKIFLGPVMECFLSVAPIGQSPFERSPKWWLMMLMFEVHQLMNKDIVN